ncbi:hypothetical protein A6R68_20112 [Neotoma lepida]|uniref:Uncharacterized protein n=1 Tax=Neotoma lepida TaxID=56216 RepID=A0A1A6HTS0_NEOLE|nr:hypothetical protein A6R68_20112 [Neotoma lepida]
MVSDVVSAKSKVGKLASLEVLETPLLCFWDLINLMSCTPLPVLDILVSVSFFLEEPGSYAVSEDLEPHS